MAVLIRQVDNARIGSVVLDLEESFSENMTVTWSEERIATGAVVSDHSQLEPEVFTIRGAVASLANPFTSPADFGQQLGSGIAENLSPVDLQLNTRVEDAREDIKAIVRNREQFEYIGAGGRLTVAAKSLENEFNFENGETYTFSMTVFRILRSTVETFANATALGDETAGSAIETAKGPTRLGGAVEHDFT